MDTGSRGTARPLNGPDTRDSLLQLIGDPNQAQAWDEFVAIYRPLIFRIAKGRGLQTPDAEDLTQQVLISVNRVIANWNRDESKAGFRAWLATVTRNAVINALSRRPADAAVGGSDFLGMCDQVPETSNALESAIEREHQRSILRLAADQVRNEVDETTWLAFWWTSIESVPVKDAAERLGLTVGAVYGARARVMSRLKATAVASRERVSGDFRR